MASESSIRSPSSPSPSSPEGSVQGDRLAAVLLHLDDLLRSHVQLGRQFLGGGLAAQLLEHLPLHPGQLADGLGRMRREADGAGLVGHRPGDRLPDPPGGIRGELVAPGVVELLHAADHAQVPLLDQVQEQHPVPGVPPGQRHDQPQVGLHQMVLGPPAVFGDLLKVDPRFGGKVPAAFGELLLGEQPGLDPLGQLDLLPGVEQRHPADLLEVVPNRVGRSAGGCHPGDRTVLVAGRARRRAGSRHGHPLPEIQDNEAEHTAEPALSANCRKTT